MCLGIPGKVIAIKNKKAKVKQSNHHHWVDISLLDTIKVGDFVLTYQQAAIDKVSSKEAKKTLKLLKTTNSNEKRKC